VNIEKIKKVNQLSKEFKKHGMAMEEALEQASDSVHEEEIKEFLQESKEQMNSAKNPSSTEQYIIMLERNNRKIIEEVQKVKEEVTKIMNEFEDIKRKLHEQSVPSQQPVQEEITQKKIEKQAKLTPKKKIKNPRQGDINPEDVSIEKMFYYGKK
jgi:uncharacterized protein (DUF111 family)